MFKNLRFAKNLILRSDTGYVKTAKKVDGQLWQKTPYANLIRYKPSKTYFARIRIGGKLIRQSLKTGVISVAKLRLGDLEKKERQRVENQAAATDARMTFATSQLRFAPGASRLSPAVGDRFGPWGRIYGLDSLSSGNKTGNSGLDNGIEPYPQLDSFVDLRQGVFRNGGDVKVFLDSTSLRSC